jgi:predicted Zn-dependent protease
LGNASYTRLFVGRIADAQQAAVQALKNDPKQSWIYTNEAHAILLLGHYNEAMAIYRQHAAEDVFGDGTQTFAQASLADLEDMEKASLLFTSQQLADIKKAHQQLLQLPALGH